MKILINGVNYHVSVTGSGTDSQSSSLSRNHPPLLLLHGFTGSSRNWDAFISTWSKHCQVMAIDLMGHGESDAPADPSRYETSYAVQDVTAILDYLGVQQANVLGYSMGGRLALSLAMLQPARIHKLILESSSPGLAEHEDRISRIKQDDDLAQKLETNGLAWFVDYWDKISLFDSLQEADRLTLREQRMRNRVVGLVNSLRGMGTGMQPSWWHDLNTLQLPVLLLAGELDSKFSLIAENMAAVIPNSTFTQVKKAGHLIHVEQPQIFDTIVVDYLGNE